MQKLEKDIKKFISDNNLIDPDDSILIALSSGPDSTALLLLLSNLRTSFKFNLAACYINHNIRSKSEIKKEVEFCWKLCDKLQIDFHLINEDIPSLAKEAKQSIETTARNFRRDILLQLADIDGYNKIALAHHLDDKIETILFRLFRGTGPGGLNPVEPISGIFIRPLCNTEKTELLNYLKAQKIKPMIDKTNLKSDYDRNYIRNKIIPVIEKRFGYKYKSSILNLSRIIDSENRYLDNITRKKFKKCSYITPGGKIVVDLKELSSYDVWLRRRIIKEGLKAITGHPGAGSFEDIENINRVICGHLKATSISGNISTVNDKNCLIIAREKLKINTAEIDIDRKINRIDRSGKIEIVEIDKDMALRQIQKSGHKINIDFDSITPPLYVRNIRPGDRFIPLGNSGTKKIGDYLTDKKVSRYVRDEIFVLEDKNGIIWLIGYEIADRVKIDKKTKRAGQIEYCGKKGIGSAEVRSALFAR